MTDMKKFKDTIHNCITMVDIERARYEEQQKYCDTTEEYEYYLGATSACEDILAYMKKECAKWLKD